MAATNKAVSYRQWKGKEERLSLNEPNAVSQQLECSSSE